MIAETNVEALHSMVCAGRAQIAELENKISAIEKNAQEAHDELTTIADHSHYEAAQLVRLRESISQLEAEYTTAAGYAKLAQGKLYEKSAAKEAAQAKKALADAQRELARQEHAYEDICAARSARQVELEALLVTLASRKEAAQGMINGVQAGYHRASLQYGDMRHASLVEGFTTHQGHVLEAREHLLAAQIELHNYFADGVNELAEWPDLQKQFRHLMPADDATVRMIEGTLFYIDLIMRDSDHVNDNFTTSWNVWHELYIHEGDLRGYHSHLIEQRARLETLLTEYRACEAGKL